MNTTIVFAHPWKGSLNRAILEKVMEHLRQAGDRITLIDLYEDGFNPVMSEKDLSLYGRGKSADPMVERYNAILDETEKIIFLFPIWWYDMPAILRGFFDKVMLENCAFTDSDNGLQPVRNIRHTVVLTTSAATTDALIHEFGDPVRGTIIAGTFKILGFHNARWHNLGGLNGKTKVDVAQYLEKIPEFLAAEGFADK